jgi:hypothetical protein
MGHESFISAMLYKYLGVKWVWDELLQILGWLFVRSDYQKAGNLQAAQNRPQSRLLNRTLVIGEQVVPQKNEVKV